MYTCSFVQLLGEYSELHHSVCGADINVIISRVNMNSGY